jgi:hypothetical protein
MCRHCKLYRVPLLENFESLIALPPYARPLRPPPRHRFNIIGLFREPWTPIALPRLTTGSMKPASAFARIKRDGAA